MKIIKPGRAQKEWAKEYKCTGTGNGGGGCGAVLLVDKSDLFQTGKHFYDGSSEHFVTFKCEGCGSLNDITDWLGSALSLPTQVEWQKIRSLQQNEI